MTAHDFKDMTAAMNPSISLTPESPRRSSIPDKSSPRQKQQQSQLPQQQEAAASQQTQPSTDQQKSQQQRTPEPVAKTIAASSKASSVTPDSSGTGGDNNGDVIGEYVLGETIGKGTFGKVRLGLHLLTGEKVAVKILEKKRIVQAADVERVAREIKILKRNRHQNVIQLYEVIDSPERIFLIMEHVDGGEMFEYIVTNHRIREPEAAFLFRQIVDGLAYLHANEVTHRDLKPENLLLQANRHNHRHQQDQAVPCSLLVKIVDFGLSNTHDGGRLLRTACGSPCYAAPEMIQGRLYHGPIADMWSLGVVLFAMVCGFLPFEDSNTNLLYKKILSANYKMPTFLSPNVQDLIRRILETDPEKRYTVDKIRQHSWLAGVSIPDVAGFEPNAVNSDEAKARHDLVLGQLEALGLPKNDVQGALSKKAFNRFTASYYLLDGKLRRVRKNRISLPSTEQTSPSSDRPARREGSTSNNEAKRPEQPTNGSEIRAVESASVQRKQSGTNAGSHGQSPSLRAHDGATETPRRRSNSHHHTSHPHHNTESPYARRVVTPSSSNASPRHSGQSLNDSTPQRPSSVRGGRNLVLTNGSTGISTGTAFLPVAPNPPRDHRHSGVLVARKPQGSTRVTVSNGMVALRPLVQPPRKEPQASTRRYSTESAQHMIVSPPLRTNVDTTPRHMSVVPEAPSHHALTTTNGGVIIRRRPLVSAASNHADHGHSSHRADHSHSSHQSPMGVNSSTDKSDDTRSPQRIVPPLPST